jgi:putative membrane protein
MMKGTAVALLAPVILLGSAACSKPEPSPPPAAPQVTAGAVAQHTTAGDTFGVLHAIHSAEIEQGEVAIKNANDPRVKAFAESVVNDHKARMQKDQQIMSGLGIEPRESYSSQQMKAEGERQTSQLSSLSGTAFDRAYLDDQIGYFRQVLDTFDQDLIPNARDPQVKARLVDARERANRHLKEAQDLRVSLATR